MRCATHPEVETELRCATCGIPICPDCLVETPVGMKCREHGVNPPPPIYRVSPAGYGAAVLAGFALAAVGGALVLRLPSLWVVLALGIVGGRMIGEAIWYSSGWKRGPRLAGLAALIIGVGAVVGGPLLARLWSGLPPLDAAALARHALGAPLPWVFGAIAATAAYWRIR